MQGNAKVYSELKRMSRCEARAVDHYNFQAQILKGEGLMGLKHAWHGFRKDSRHYQKKVRNRLLVLGGQTEPADVMSDAKPEHFSSIAQLLEQARSLESDIAGEYNKAYEKVEDAGDNATAFMLCKLQRKHEKSEEWLHKQQLVLQKLGLPLYLAKKG